MVEEMKEIVMSLSKATIESHKAAEAGAFRTAYKAQLEASRDASIKLYAMYKSLQEEESHG